MNVYSASLLDGLLVLVIHGVECPVGIKNGLYVVHKEAILRLA